MQGLAAQARAAAAPATPATVPKPDEPTKMDKVVVEDTKAKQLASPKFTEPLRDTPQTVIVIPQDVYTQQGAASLSEVLRNTPGITFAAGEGGGSSSTAGDAFYMRGFDTSSNIFVDGVRDVGAYTRDVYNLEQVEIAKGPAGSDVGRGASTGYVNLATKSPRLENFTAGTLSYGFDEDSSSDRRRATLDVNQQLANASVKGLAFRLNAVWQDSGIPGRDTAENKSWSIAPSLALGLGTPTRAIFSYQRGKQDNLPDYGLPAPAYPGNTITPVPPPIARTNYYGFTADQDKISNEAAVARFEHDVSPDLRLSNQTRFSANERDAIITAPGTSLTSYAPATQLLTRSRQGNKRNTDILSNQTNLVARLLTGGVRHDITSGFEFSREQAYSPAFVSVTLTPIPVTSPNPGTTPSGTPGRSGAYTDAEIETSALYAFDTIKLNERWQFNGGLRVEGYQVDYLSVPTGTAAASRINADHSLVTWKAGLVFKPVTAGSLYVAYGLSEKPPGSDFTLSSAIGNQNNPDTDPQETKNLEAGVKWEFFGGQLATTAALFKTENDKTVYTDPVLGPIPAGSQTVQGVEFSASGKLTDNLLVFGGFSYLDSEYTVGTAAQVGTGLPLVARVSGNFWTTYRLPFGLTLGGGAQYSGKANRLQTTAGSPVAMPSYWLFNAVASYDINPRLGLRLNINNLFDEEYVQSYNNNGGRFNFGSPRAVLLTASFKL